MPNTTQLLFEAFAIGSIASIWAGLLLLHFPRVRGFVDAVGNHGTLAPLFLLIAVAAIYQLGFFVNWIAWRITRKLFEDYRKELFKAYDTKWQDVRPLVRQRASGAIIRELDVEVSEMRMCRANSLNGVLIGGSLLTYGFSLVPLALIVWAGTLMLMLQTRHVHRHHFEKLQRTYTALLIEMKHGDASSSNEVQHIAARGEE